MHPTDRMEIELATDTTGQFWSVITLLTAPAPSSPGTHKSGSWQRRDAPPRFEVHEGLEITSPKSPPAGFLAAGAQNGALPGKSPEQGAAHGFPVLTSTAVHH